VAVGVGSDHVIAESSNRVAGTAEWRKYAGGKGTSDASIRSVYLDNLMSGYSMELNVALQNAPYVNRIRADSNPGWDLHNKWQPLCWSIAGVILANVKLTRWCWQLVMLNVEHAPGGVLET